MTAKSISTFNRKVQHINSISSFVPPDPSQHGRGGHQREESEQPQDDPQCGGEEADGDDGAGGDGGEGDHVQVGGHQELGVSQGVFTTLDNVDVARDGRQHHYDTNAVIMVGCKVLETGSRVAKGLEFSWKSWTNIGVLIAYLQEVKNNLFQSDFLSLSNHFLFPERDNRAEPDVPEAGGAAGPRHVHVRGAGQHAAGGAGGRDQGAGRPPEAQRVELNTFTL